MPRFLSIVFAVIVSPILKPEGRDFEFATRLAMSNLYADISTLTRTAALVLPACTDGDLVTTGRSPSKTVRLRTLLGACASRRVSTLPIKHWHGKPQGLREQVGAKTGPIPTALAECQQERRHECQAGLPVELCPFCSLHHVHTAALGPAGRQSPARKRSLARPSRNGLHCTHINAFYAKN